MSRRAQFVSSLALALCALAAPAAAQVPNRLGYTGYLSDDSGPVTAEVEVSVSVFSSPFPVEGESAVWTETHPDVEVTDGAFTLAIGSRTSMPTNLFDNTDVYLELIVDGERMSPRAAIASVPFALRAGIAAQARTLIGFDPTTVQRAIDVSCAPGSFVTAISATGTATCEAARGGVTAVTAGRGLTRTALEGAVDLAVDFTVAQQRVVGTCTAGQFATSIGADGTLTCAPATNIDLSTIQARIDDVCPDGQAMFGVTSDGTPQCRAFQRQIGTTSCPNGISSIDATGSITCSTVTGGTPVTAGFGLTLAGDQFSVNPTVMQRRFVANCPFGIQSVSEDGTVTCAANSSTSYTFGFGLRNVAGTISVNDTLIQARVIAACEYGISSINANGTASCALNNDTDTNTTYSAGSGITMTGTVFSADLNYVQRRVGGNCPNGIASIGMDGAVACVSAAALPPRATQCLDSSYFMYGIDSLGNAMCRPIADFLTP